MTVDVKHRTRKRCTCNFTSASDGGRPAIASPKILISLALKILYFFHPINEIQK